MDEFEARADQITNAYEELELATSHMIEATQGTKGIINANTWKRMDKMLGDLQTLRYDVKEWMIKNGLQ